MAMFWLLLSLSALWLLLATHDLLAVLRLPSLPLSPEHAAPAPAPAVTVVMAVRDDVQHIEEAARRLLNQRHVDLHLVIVDDRSRDGTGAVLDRLAAEQSRLRAVSVTELPAGWLGKCHALQLGAADVTTRWLLFTDGDAMLTPDTIARALAAAEAAQAAHVCLLPNHRATTFLGRACLLAFQLAVQRRVLAVNSDHARAFVGTGAFNLVRTDAYRAIGGHLPLRLEIVDDVWLGCLLRRSGYRCRVWLAADDFVIDWGRSPADLVRVVEKNMFAVLRFRTLLAVLLVLGSTTAVALTFAAPWLIGAAGWLPVASYLATGIAGAAMARRMGWEVAAGLLTPLTKMLLPLAMANSLITTLRQRGVRWRDTFYSLSELRAGQVR